MKSFPWQRSAVIAHSRLLVESYLHWTGRPLLAAPNRAEPLAYALYHAPFVLVSHGTEADPLFNYANLSAQRLWELGWDALVGMPSRRTAEPEAQSDRSVALKSALSGGWVADYSGVRTSASGRRFRIQNGIIWNLLDPAGRVHGQAATFSLWTRL